MTVMTFAFYECKNDPVGEPISILKTGKWA